MEKRDIGRYLDLLEIRYRAARRDAFIIGTVFVLSLLSFFALGMTGGVTGLGLWVASAMLIAFGFAFISAIVRLETIRAVSELVRHLLPTEEAA